MKNIFFKLAKLLNLSKLGLPKMTGSLKEKIHVNTRSLRTLTKGIWYVTTKGDNGSWSCIAFDESMNQIYFDRLEWDKVDKVVFFGRFFIECFLSESNRNRCSLAAKCWTGSTTFRHGDPQKQTLRLGLTRNVDRLIFFHRFFLMIFTGTA